MNEEKPGTFFQAIMTVLQSTTFSISINMAGGEIGIWADGDVVWVTPDKAGEDKAIEWLNRKAEDT